MIQKKVDLAKIDWAELGLKVGLEIHQQLDTAHKLFCKCPTKLVDKGEAEWIVRQLRPTRSELGEVDVAALFEWRKGRLYKYFAPLTASCLVEGDEEPPHELNVEAVKIGIAVALALGSKIVDEVYVMRKIVIDGSNTTGFQRTAVIALGGSIKLPSGKVIGIQSIAIEEDAARKLGEEDRYIKYNIDRLGIPLIEISTDPDISSPEEAYEAALIIGQLLRLTHKVKRGIGTIRQDLNISIAGGVKTEIKGVQELELLPKVVMYEAVRQYRLIEIMHEMKRRGITENLIHREAKIVDITDIMKDSKSKIIKKTVSRGGVILGMKLPKMHGLLSVEVQPGRRFGTELADYARFWGGVGGIIHSDELPGYGISDEEVDGIYDVVGAVKGTDAFVIVADDANKAKKALEAIISRVIDAMKGIPRETRAVLPDGTTKYMRPQPGAARMYPETDIPPLEVTDRLIEEAMKMKPPLPHEKLSELVKKYNISTELARQLLRDVRIDLFEKLAEVYSGKIAPTFIASLLTSTLKALAREGTPIQNITDQHIEEIVSAVATGKTTKEAVEDLLRFFAENPESCIDDAIRSMGLGALSKEEITAIVKEVVREMREEVKQLGEKSFKRVMGKVMSKVRGRADGRLVAEIVKEEIKKALTSS